MMEQQQTQDNAKSDVTEKVDNLEQKQQLKHSTKKILFAIIGFIIGGPISYFFQHAAIREKFPFGEYVINCFQIMLDSESWKSNLMVGNVAMRIFLSCVICALIGYIIGHSIEKKTTP